MDNLFQKAIPSELPQSLTAGDTTILINLVIMLVFFVFILLWNKKSIKTRQFDKVNLAKPLFFCFFLAYVSIQSVYYQHFSIISAISILLGAYGLSWVAQQLYEEQTNPS